MRETAKGKGLKIAIVGGGIAGLAAAYELERQRTAGKALDWQMYEASDRLGGTVQTTRRTTEDGEYILEGGPDAWVTEKPWARELAEELGLADQIIHSNDHDKKTYLWLEGKLVAMPDRMRMMVPEDLATLDASPLFSREARQAYARELERADALKAAIPAQDESVASFVRRHFGEEVLAKIGAPLLSGVFGGDTARLSVRAVMPGFVKMEAEHGSLILALQRQRAERGERTPQATFTSLRRGMGSLAEAIVGRLPAERLHCRTSVAALAYSTQEGWLLRMHARDHTREALQVASWDHVLLATPVDETRRLLDSVDAQLAALIPTQASSAVLATFVWPPERAAQISFPPGFGFLVPQTYGMQDDANRAGRRRPRLLAGTFTTQKFPFRAPEGAKVLRAFFGGETADRLMACTDDVIAAEAWDGLHAMLLNLPTPETALGSVARWPRSLPQYEVGHHERLQRLIQLVRERRGLHLLGNGYYGVGVPDLIRDARDIARAIASQ